MTVYKVSETFADSDFQVRLLIIIIRIRIICLNANDSLQRLSKEKNVVFIL